MGHRVAVEADTGGGAAVIVVKVHGVGRTAGGGHTGSENAIDFGAVERNAVASPSGLGSAAGNDDERQLFNSYIRRYIGRTLTEIRQPRENMVIESDW